MKLLIVSFNNTLVSETHIALIKSTNKIQNELTNFSILHEYKWYYSEEILDDIVKEINEELQIYRFSSNNYSGLTTYSPKNASYVIDLVNEYMKYCKILNDG